MLKLLFILTTLLLTPTAFAGQATQQNFKVNDCYPAVNNPHDKDETEGEYNLCESHAQGLYKNVVERRQVNFAQKFILTKVVVNSNLVYFVAIEPKAKQVFVAPYEIWGENLNLKLSFSKNSNKFCFIDTGKNAENTQFNTRAENQNSRSGDIGTCLTLEKNGFNFSFDEFQ